MTHPPYVEPDEPEPAPMLDPVGWDIAVGRATLDETGIAAHPIGFARTWPNAWPAPTA